MHFFICKKTLHESVSCHNTVHLNTLGQNIVLGYCRDNPYVQQNTTKPTTSNRCVGGKRVVRESFISLFRTLQHRRQFYPEAPQSEIPNGIKGSNKREREKMLPFLPRNETKGRLGEIINGLRDGGERRTSCCRIPPSSSSFAGKKSAPPSSFPPFSRQKFIRILCNKLSFPSSPHFRGNSCCVCFFHISMLYGKERGGGAFLRWGFLSIRLPLFFRYLVAAPFIFPVKCISA